MLHSLRNRLIAVFGAVVATAMGVVFLYVVPSLRSNLISERLDRLEQVARSQQRSTKLRALMEEARYVSARQTLERVAQLANARVSLYEVSGGVLLPINITVPAHAQVPPESPLVRGATGGGIVRGRAGDGSAVVAFSMPRSVVVLSQRVDDVNETADLVERRILIATGLALLIAFFVGWGAAVTISRRVQHLERAARRMALGQFDAPIGDESPDELGQLARAFDLMQARLAQIDRSRKDFIANASHELRTPLFSLGGFLELLGDEDLDRATREEFVRTMREQVTRLGKLATDLLDLSRLDAGAVALAREPIDLSAAAQALVREFRGLAARHESRVALQRVPGQEVRGIGDEQRVQQIGRVLVDNAIRHNPPGTEVRVGVARDNGSAVLTVADDGPGIDEETRQHLFERFYRGSDATAAGSGLGLAIARELALRMDGSLEVESGEGRTVFRLGLPAAEERSPDQEREAERAPV